MSAILAALPGEAFQPDLKLGFQQKQASLYKNYPHPSQVRSAHHDTVCTTTFDSHTLRLCNLFISRN